MHYVIGDIHGCYQELIRLLDVIDTMDNEATIYFVGDWIDRGPQVAEVMNWVTDNVTVAGKYQSVRGNHDQEALEWYYKEFKRWQKKENHDEKQIPETKYDFAEVVVHDFECDPKKLNPFFTKVKKMPYSKRIKVTTSGGVQVTYRLCHAWYSGKSHGKGRKNENLYARRFGGNFDSNEIIVHGHTPTISQDYRHSGQQCEDRPGLIGYRNNAINVDGGCCYHREYSSYACMLCAICLENLEEIYPYSLEERLMKGAHMRAEDILPPNVLSDEIEAMATVCYEDVLRQYVNKDSSRYRQLLLERLGLEG